jgi:pimeloyl-ACP methyl ester carboxylesterase
MQTFPEPTIAQFYTWQSHRCAYEVCTPPDSSPAGVPLLLIHPIGVGLSRQFWRRFVSAWYAARQQNQMYLPDLLGCGESDLPHVAYHPIDWATQLQAFLQSVVQTPVVILVQGALLPVAIDLTLLQPNLVRGLVLCGPPAWTLMTQATPAWQHRLSWNLFDTPGFGQAFYRYARRAAFLRSFSARQLFAHPEDVDAEWITTLQQGAADPQTRHAVFSFLSGFWRQDYGPKLAAIAQPTLVVMGEQASSISREGKQESPDQRIADYLACLPNAQSVKVPGRNVLSYESPIAFVNAIAPFIQAF